MYKNTSHNMQRRETNRAIQSRKNVAGIDPSAFEKSDLENERKVLVNKKLNLERSLAQTGAYLQISESQRSPYATGEAARMSNAVRWTQQRMDAKRELAAVELRLGEIKLLLAAQRTDDEKTFERTFMSVAKEILAGPVYERLLTATIHRVGEGNAEADSRMRKS